MLREIEYVNNYVLTFVKIQTFVVVVTDKVIVYAVSNVIKILWFQKMEVGRNDEWKGIY